MPMPLPFDMQLKFDALIYQNADVMDFETWIYETPNLENYFAAEEYLELISLNYKQQDIRHLINKYFGHHLETGKIETHHLIACLERLANKTETFGLDLQQIYHKYCYGYSFLKSVVQFYLYIDGGEPFFILGKLVEQNKERLYPQVKDKALQLIEYLQSGKIVILKVANFENYQDKPLFLHTLSDEEFKSLTT